jgi:ABC-type multidrug transport system permease subunit
MLVEMLLQVSVFIVPAFNIPLVLFSGFFLNLRDVPKWLRWLTDVSYFRYAFEGMVLSVYGYNRPDLECSEVDCYFKSPLKYLQEFEMADGVYAYDILALVIWAVAAYVLIFCALKYRIRNLQ